MNVSSVFLFGFVGCCVGLVTLCLSISLNIVKFASLITVLQRDLVSLKKEMHGLRTTFNNSNEETKRWRERMEEVIFRPSWKSTNPNQK